MSVIRVENLCVSLSEKPILQDIHFDISPGETLALTGESGSGKSMTALSIMQLLPEGAQTRGEVQFEDQNLLECSEETLCALRGRKIGMVFQEPMTALNPVQTIGAQVAEVFRIHNGLSRRQATSEAAKTLTSVDLNPNQVPLSRYPHELSGGQRQRVVIAMAVALRPRLLIADEPTTALDVTTQAEILELLTGIARYDDMAMLFITHDLSVVSHLADRICVMKDGKIVEQGEKHSLLKKPKEAYTQSLISASKPQRLVGPKTSDQPLLQVSGVTRRYGGHSSRPALSDVSFTICANERVGLVGKSGCGKSTLTKAILGLDPVSDGVITLRGVPVRVGGRPNPHLIGDMQVVFQDPFSSFNPRHRVAQIIAEPFFGMKAQPDAATRQQHIINSLLEVGLSADDAMKYPHQLSGGQRQRVAIARALITQSRLVIFDEAVSALDVSVRAQILELIAKLVKDHQLTFLFISHDLSVVRSVCDRVLVMDGGQIVEDRSTDEIFDTPKHPCTRELIKASLDWTIGKERP